MDSTLLLRKVSLFIFFLASLCFFRTESFTSKTCGTSTFLQTRLVRSSYSCESNFKNESKMRLNALFNFWNASDKNKKKKERQKNKLSEDIMKYAHDPILFEKAVMEQRKKILESENRTKSGTEQELKRKPYQSIEQWDEEAKIKSRDSSSWEERVQYEGQIHGDRFKQNEILRQNLKNF